MTRRVVSGLALAATAVFASANVADCRPDATTIAEVRPQSEPQAGALPSMDEEEIAALLKMTEEAPPNVANKEADFVPPWGARAIDSGVVFSSKELKGQPYGVVFANSSCNVSCRTEFDALSELVFVDFTLFIAIGDANPARVLSMVPKQMRQKATFLDDSKLALAKRFGVTGMPTTAIVDDRGRVEYWVAGFANETPDLIKEAFAKYLAEE